MIFAHQNVAIGLTSRLRDLGLEELEVRVFSDDHSVLLFAQSNQYGLGASIFSADETAARALARQLPTGFVTINDLIVPTADPRFPFGGVRKSGFGVTRGAEGLLEMTHPHVISVRRSRWLPHLDEVRVGDEQLFTAYIRVAYGRGLGRLNSLRAFLRSARQRGGAAGVSPAKTHASHETNAPSAADTAASRFGR